MAAGGRRRARPGDRRILLAAIGLTALILAGLVELSSRSRDDGVRPEFAPIVLEGDGAHRSDVDLVGGPLLVRAGHNGTGSFRATLVGDDGARLLLAGGTDGYRGVRVVPAPAGPHELEVDAAGRWAVALEQPTWDEAVPLPVAVEGEGESVSDPFSVAEEDVSAEGLAVDVRTAAGAGLDLRVLDEAGDPVAELAAPEGPSALPPLPAGRWLLDVRTDGVWRVELQPVTTAGTEADADAEPTPSPDPPAAEDG